jgi:phytoene dehydrogenase-like protein
LVDQAWDVILIGAGQNSFALGSYLGMAGLKTVICESRLENGGRLASEEITLPGYWHNTLAYFQDNRESSPVWEELQWEKRHHAEFVAPPVIGSLLLRDGRAVSQHQSLDDTIRSISRFSERDAAAWRRFHDTHYALIRNFLIPYYYQPPRWNTAAEQALDAEPGGKEFLRLWRMTCGEVVDELFECDGVKTLVLSQMAIPRGVAVDYPGSGIEVLKLIAGDEKPELARGGSHSIAQVLQRAYVRNGGQIRAMHAVDKILLAEGRAAGVRLRDGREWKARLAVVSDAHPYSTFIEMIGAEHLPTSFIERVESIELDEFSCFQVHLALKAPLRYAFHEAADPAIRRAMNITMGPETPAHLYEMWQEIRAGEFPRHVCLHAVCPSVFDPLQAPNAKHTASLYMPVPFQLKGREPQDWVKLKNDFMSSVLEIWRGYATNLTEENIEMKVALDPFYIAGRWPNMRRGGVWGARKVLRQMGVNRPLEELSGYRTPVEGLYQIGVATHPADAVIGGSGRNCWQVMKEDLKLEVREPTVL